MITSSPLFSSISCKVAPLIFPLAFPYTMASFIKIQQKIQQISFLATLPQRICYSHWANGARNGVISIGQWGVFNHKKGAI